MEEEEDYETYLDTENERYTQSYTGPTEDEYPWEEEEKKELTEEEKKKLEEEKEEERRRKIKEINQRTKERAKEKEKEMEGFEYPRDYSPEWQEYTEEGYIYRQHRVSGEKICFDKDWTYKSPWQFLG